MGVTYVSNVLLLISVRHFHFTRSHLYMTPRDIERLRSRLIRSNPVVQARLMAGRGLAYEGMGDWQAAVHDYDTALDTARASDLKPDPYVLNSRANALGSLGRWSGPITGVLKLYTQMSVTAGTWHNNSIPAVSTKHQPSGGANLLRISG